MILLLFDSVIAQTQYVDYNLTKNTNYYYAIQAYDLSKPDPYSNLSNTVKFIVTLPDLLLLH